MKKVRKCFLVTVLCMFFLAGCKSKAATEVETLISNIGEVSLESEDAIVQAEEYYETLTDNQKDQVETYKILVDARKQYDALVEEKRQAEELASFEEKAKDLSKQTVKKQSDIDEINKAYNALNDDQKKQLEDSDLLAKATELTDYEKAAVSAVKQLRSQLKNQDSLVLSQVNVRMGGENTTAAYYVLVKYSATNSFGGAIDDTTCIDVTKDFSSLFWEMTRLFSRLGANADVDEQDMTIYNLYLHNSTDEMEVDCDRIMENIDAALTASND